MEESRRQVTRLSAPVNITTDDLKAVLIGNPDLIDFETWKTLSQRSGAVKSLVGDLGGEGINQGKGDLGGEGIDQGKKTVPGEGGGSHAEKGAEQTERVFKCEQSQRCQKKFKSLKGYERHIKEYHQGEKNFGCTDCGKRFITLKLLKKHGKIHRKTEVICTCTVCGIEKRNAYQLKRHMDQQHEEGKGVCHLCSVDFGPRADLRKHLKSCGRKQKSVGNMQVHLFKTDT